MEKSIEEAEKNNDLQIQKEAIKKLSELYENKGDLKKALLFYQKYVTLVDTFYSRKEVEIDQSNKFDREIIGKQNKIVGLAKDQELSISKLDLASSQEQLVLESNKRQSWLIYFLIFSLFLLSLVVFFFYRSNKKQRIANNVLALKSLRSQNESAFYF